MRRAGHCQQRTGDRPVPHQERVLAPALCLRGGRRLAVPVPAPPRHLVSSLAIGIPGFVLALGPNTRRFESGFAGRVLRFAVPAGAVTAVAVMLGYGLARAQDSTPAQARTAATIVFLLASLWGPGLKARPLPGWKVSLVGAMGALSALAFVVPTARNFVELQLPAVPALGLSMVFGAAAAWAIALVARHPVARGTARYPPSAAGS